jgi:hypothetical protein
VRAPKKAITTKLDCITSKKTVIFIMHIVTAWSYCKIAEINLKFGTEICLLWSRVSLKISTIIMTVVSDITVSSISSRMCKCIKSFLIIAVSKRMLYGSMRYPFKTPLKGTVPPFAITCKYMSASPLLRCYLNFFIIFWVLIYK